MINDYYDYDIIIMILSQENEASYDHFSPGVLSEALRTALGMPATGDYPPPWLVNQQRHGTPPAYPSLKIPGLNAPVPPGQTFGYHVGGWGKPPVDEFNRPLHPGVLGVAVGGAVGGGDVGGVVYSGTGVQVLKADWGAMPERGEESSSEEEASDSEEEEEEEEGNGDGDGGDVSVAPSDGTSSVASNINLRKEAGAGDETPLALAEKKSLYTVLEVSKNKERAGAGGEIFGSANTYVMPGTESSVSGMESVAGDESVLKKSEKRKKRKKGGDDSDEEEGGGGKKFKF